MAALLLKIEDAAEQLGVSRSKAYDLVAAGTLPSVRLGPRCVRVPAVWLERWVEQQVGVASELVPIAPQAPRCLLGMEPGR